VSIPVRLLSENLRRHLSIFEETTTVEALKARIDRAEFDASQARQVAETNPNYQVRMRYTRKADEIEAASDEARRFVYPSILGMFGPSREVRAVEGLQVCATPACEELIPAGRRAYALHNRCETCIAAFMQLELDNTPSA
jgi:hypothetical protein